MTVPDKTGPRSPAKCQTTIVRTAMCRALQRLERTVETAMGPQLAAGPYRALILEIYLAEMEGRTIYQSSLSTDAAASKPHRRSIRLAELGALSRDTDSRDRRRTGLLLTATTKAALDHTMDLVRDLFSCVPSISNQIFDQPPELMLSERVWYNNNHGQAAVIVNRGRAVVDDGIALPATISRALGLRNGDTVFFRLEGNEVRIRTAQSALRLIQERLRAFPREGNLVSEQLIVKRREEISDD